MREDLLLRLPVGIEVEFHHHQLGQVAQKSGQRPAGTMDIADEGYQRVARSQRAIEIKENVLLGGVF